MQQATSQETHLTQCALVVTGALLGVTMFVRVPGTMGWAGGAAVLAGTEYYRRKERLGLLEATSGAGQWLLSNVNGAVKSTHQEATDVLPVYRNAAQKLADFADAGGSIRPALDVAAWMETPGSLRCTIIGGKPGEGKTHASKWLIASFLQAFPEHYLKICTMDRGLSHDDTEPETWLDLPDEFFAETIEDIESEIFAADAELEQRYHEGRQRKRVNKFPYLVFVDELVATMGKIRDPRRKEALDLAINNILVRGPKARVWLMGATQRLDCKGTALSQATFLLFDFVLFPILGGNAKVWRNLPDVSGQEDAIAELLRAPHKAPKPVFVIRDGDGKMMTIPRVNLPEKLSVIDAENPIDEWVQKASDFIDSVSDLPITTAWQAVCDEFPDVPKRRNDNKFFDAFRVEFDQRQSRT